MKEKKRNLNREIKAYKVQVIDDEGNNLGEMFFEEAMKKATEEGLDLMEMWKKWDIVIVKMLDYGKYLYKQKKQEQKQKQKGKTPELKTIRITFRIGEHDLEIRKKQAEKFAKEGHPLKVSMIMKGRENQHVDIAKEKMLSFIESLSEFYKIEKSLTQSGNTIHVSLKTLK